MSSAAKSKFTEILDASNAPSYSNLNVSLEDILAETARRRSSSGSESNSRSGTNSPTSSTAPTNEHGARARLRRITLGSKNR
jgi:hypothetical protein